MAEMHIGKKRGSYTKYEMEIIRKYYPDGGYNKVQEFLPYRSNKGIAEKARTMGIKSNNRKVFSEREINILEKHYPVGGYKKVLEYLPSRTQDSIHQKASELGIQGTMNYYTKEEDDIIRKHYPRGGYEEVQEFLVDRDKDSIQRRASKINVSYLSYNKHYFNSIDTEDKAYWLGFMYADGYVTSQSRWGLKLSSRDLDHIKKFTKDFDSNINIRVKKVSSEFPTHTSHHEECSFVIKNSTMYKDLVRQGVVRNKTWILEFPTEEQVPKHLMNHFIRGFFDGDGSYTFYEYTGVRKDRGNKKSTRTYKEISLVNASEPFMNRMQEYLLDNNIDMYMSTCKETKLKTLRTGKASNIVNFIDYVYKDSITHLDRKYESAQKMYEYCLSYLKEYENKAQ